MGLRIPEKYWGSPLKKGADAGKVFGQNIGAWVRIAKSASYLVAVGFSLRTGFLTGATNDKTFRNRNQHGI